MISQERALLGIKLISAFFALGAAICLVTIIALLFPGGALEPIWRLNPDAQAAFQKIGRLSILLMFVVGSASGLTAFGLAKRTQWGHRFALGILSFSLSGALFNALVRYDLRT